MYAPESSQRPSKVKVIFDRFKIYRNLSMSKIDNFNRLIAATSCDHKLMNSVQYGYVSQPKDNDSYQCTSQDLKQCFGGGLKLGSPPNQGFGFPYFESLWGSSSRLQCCLYCNDRTVRVSASNLPGCFFGCIFQGLLVPTKVLFVIWDFVLSRNPMERICAIDSLPLQKLHFQQYI